MMATSTGNGGSDESKWSWDWLCREDTDIEYFHIKTAFLRGENIVFFGRGKPKGVNEICASFLLTVPLTIVNGKITGVKTNEYTWVKVD